MPSLNENESAAVVLRKAKELIETRGWTQNRFARNADGRGLWQRSEMMTYGACFCLSGSIVAQGAKNEHGALAFLEKAIGSDDIAFFNDRTCSSKEEAIEKLDRAIALAESQS